MGFFAACCQPSAVYDLHGIRSVELRHIKETLPDSHGGIVWSAVPAVLLFARKHDSGPLIADTEA
jgi:hypothetical protein